MKQTTCKNCDKPMPIRNSTAAKWIKLAGRPLCSVCRATVKAFATGRVVGERTSEYKELGY